MYNRTCSAIAKVYIGVISIYRGCRVVYHGISNKGEFLCEVKRRIVPISKLVVQGYFLGVIFVGRFIIRASGKKYEGGGGSEKQCKAFHRAIGLRGLVNKGKHFFENESKRKKTMKNEPILHKTRLRNILEGIRRDYIAMNNNYRKATALFMLTPQDVAQLDFKKPIYLRQYAQAYIVTKVNYKQNASIVEMLLIR